LGLRASLAPLTLACELLLILKECGSVVPRVGGHAFAIVDIPIASQSDVHILLYEETVNMKGKTNSFLISAMGIGLALMLQVVCPRRLQAQGDTPKYEVDLSWPKPLPDKWVTGSIGGICADNQDHVFVLNRHNLTDNELDAGHQAPPVLEFDTEGGVVNSWGDPEVLGLGGFHSCMVDRENNVWMTYVGDGIVQKYSHNGKLLLQIGKKGVVDSSDGTLTGKALNSSHTAFFRPSGIAFDPKNGDLYISDGEYLDGNHRVAVFDRDGQFLRQWGPHRAENETGDAWKVLVVCVSVDIDGNVYTCDRVAHRLQMFDRMGNFKKNIPIPFEQRSQYTTTGPGHPPGAWGLVVPGAWGTAVSVSFSRDPEQKFMFVSNEDDEQIEILDRASGRILSSFGRAGHQVGEFTHLHHTTIDSKGNIYVGEVSVGARIQKFKLVGSQ
jgi:DNA-binding beta-propeller fold protein YncE